MSLIKLQGNASGTGAFTIAAPNSNTDRTLTLPDATGTVLAAPAGSVTINSSAPSNSLTVDGSGNLGLGVTPSAWSTANSLKAIQIGNSGAISSLQAATTNNQIFVTTNAYQASGGWTYLFSDAATQYRQYLGEHAWFNAPSGTAGNAITFTQRMTLDTNGALLVGTTDSGLSGTNTGIWARGALGVLQVSRSSDPSLNLCRIGTDGTIATFAKGTTTVGNISVTGSSTAYNTSSDYRLKEDWQPMTGASERVLALKPVNFAWKADGSRVDGFLAHEAQAVVPEAVTGAKDEVDDEGNPKYQGIDQSKLVPLLTAALQEALAEIANLKTRLTALEAN